jgi:hypothetical protein
MAGATTDLAAGSPRHSAAGVKVAARESTRMNAKSWPFLPVRIVRDPVPFASIGVNSRGDLNNGNR